MVALHLPLWTFRANRHQSLPPRLNVCDPHTDALVLHIPTTSEGKSLLLAPFYSFFFFDIRGPSFEDAHSDVNTNPAWIAHDIAKYIPKGATLYIATDYADAAWFDPLREQYRLYFASDFKGVFDSLLPWYREMVEQLICARSQTFVGTYYSSFSYESFDVTMLVVMTPVSFSRTMHRRCQSRRI
jgi:hypothetical protein